VYGRDLRLPIEGDWRPRELINESEDIDYDKHMRTLAQRLHEANKVAGQQSKLSHETAKRYYDRQATREQFKREI
jgi:hypothetical protein